MGNNADAGPHKSDETPCLCLGEGIFIIHHTQDKFNILSLLIRGTLRSNWNCNLARRKARSYSAGQIDLVTRAVTTRRYRPRRKRNARQVRTGQLSASGLEGFDAQQTSHYGIVSVG